MKKLKKPRYIGCAFCFLVGYGASIFIHYTENPIYIFEIICSSIGGFAGGLMLLSEIEYEEKDNDNL